MPNNIVLNKFNDGAVTTASYRLFNRSVILLSKEYFVRLQWHLRLGILNELPLVTDSDERGSFGETDEFYSHVNNMLYTSIMSPLNLLNLSVEKFRILSLSSYELCFKELINFVALL